MKEVYSKIIPVDIYCRDILFYFGDADSFQEELYKYHDKKTAERIFENMDISEYNMGKTYINFANNAFVFYMPHIPRDAFEYSFLTHEIFHVTVLLMKSIGASLTDESEEAYAYLNGFLSKRVMEEFPICSFCECGQKPVSEHSQQQ